MAVSILWFRQDLRLADNPALIASARDGDVLPVYILDDESAREWRMGATSRCWLHRSLQQLSNSLNHKLLFFEGDPKSILGELVERSGAVSVHWNRCYEPWHIARDKQVKERLQSSNCKAESHGGSLLWEPWQVAKADGSPYKVFTPYYKKGCLQQVAPRAPLPVPEFTLFDFGAAQAAVGSQLLQELKLLPKIDWNSQFDECWEYGEAGARKTMHQFLENGLSGYREGRNFPAKQNVSRLSPSLHFGEISPNQLWYASAAAAAQQQSEPGIESDLEHFHSELGWREFSYYLLYHFPSLPDKNLQSRFDRFGWQWESDLFERWQKGCTGYPVVDAGMRELWKTGYMHNRVRMITGSFLVKNLLIHWQRGERWFWDCLVDADLAANSASWQWIAGCGADAAPYFRIFNPVTQGERFDPEGEYVRRYVPELNALPDRWIHRPWEAPVEVLEAAGLELGRDYPRPIVDLRLSRELALQSFSDLKNNA